MDCPIDMTVSLTCTDNAIGSPAAGSGRNGDLIDRLPEVFGRMKASTSCEPARRNSPGSIPMAFRQASAAVPHGPQSAAESGSPPRSTVPEAELNSLRRVSASDEGSSGYPNVSSWSRCLHLACGWATTPCSSGRSRNAELLRTSGLLRWTGHWVYGSASDIAVWDPRSCN